MELFKKPTGACTVTKVLVEESYYAPKVDVQLNALLKMRAFIQNSTTEIAWLGIVEKHNNHYVITDVDLMQQNVSGVTAELHESGLQEYAERLIAAGNVDDLNKIKMWGHSHVNMEVFPSGTDEDTFKEYYKNCEFFIRLIANKKGAMKIDIVELNTELRFDNVDWNIIYPESIVNIITKRKRFEEDIKKTTKEFDSICEGLYKELEPIAKTNILRYVKQETTIYKGYSNYKSYGRYDEDDADGFYTKKKDEIPFGTDDGYDDDDFEIPLVLINKGETNEAYVFINNLFDDEEIIYMNENLFDRDGLHELLGSLGDYVNYDLEDWADLYDAIADYYCMIIKE